jgi:sugar/nucleoside kinase (ribokinase family)
VGVAGSVKFIRKISPGAPVNLFVGALCAELSRGQEIQLAAQTASIAGALATTIRGAVPSLPTRDAVTQHQAI